MRGKFDSILTFVQNKPLLLPSTGLRALFCLSASFRTVRRRSEGKNPVRRQKKGKASVEYTHFWVHDVKIDPERASKNGLRVVKVRLIGYPADENPSHPEGEVQPFTFQKPLRLELGILKERKLLWLVHPAQEGDPMQTIGIILFGGTEECSAGQNTRILELKALIEGWGYRLEAAKLLAQFGSRDAIPVLTEFLEAPEGDSLAEQRRLEAAMALMGVMDAEELFPRLRDLQARYLQPEADAGWLQLEIACSLLRLEMALQDPSHSAGIVRGLAGAFEVRAFNFGSGQGQG